MLVKIRDLTGPALDWAVAKAEGWTFKPSGIGNGLLYATTERPSEWLWLDMFRPSANPAHAYPIIDRDGISVIRCDDDYGRDAQGFTTSERIPVWAATNGQHSTTTSTEHQQHNEMFQIGADNVMYGPTPLVAAMRCHVCVKHSSSRWQMQLDLEIDVPDELLAA